MSARNRLAATDELERFLARHPDIQAVQIFLTDPSGVTRGKSVRREELARIFESGRAVAGSILGLDITGEDVDATGLVWDTRRRRHDGTAGRRHAAARAVDRRARPVS